MDTPDHMPPIAEADGYYSLLAMITARTPLPKGMVPALVRFPP